MSNTIDRLYALASLEEMARLAVLAVLQDCTLDDQIAVMNALRPSVNAWARLVDLAEENAEQAIAQRDAAQTTGGNWMRQAARYKAERDALRARVAELEAVLAKAREDA